MNTRWLLVLTLLVPLGFGCGDDGGGAADAGPDSDASQMPDGAPEPDAGQDPAARGQYLVDHVAACGDCHTPRLQNGMLDEDNYLAGAECFIDVVPNNDNMGCLHTRNLTDHATGLANRSEAEIKAMFLDGVRPNGDALHDIMPYWLFHNMSEADADAIVAYLRTVEGVDHQVPNNQTPWDQRPSTPTQPMNPNLIPEPDSSDPNFESAMRGRYLATAVAGCMECHTAEPDDSSYPIDTSALFQGGRVFAGIVPMPPFNTDTVTTANLTPHATGLEGWSASDIVTALKDGEEMDGNVVCPPMPAGTAYAGLTDEDATDIANYVLSLDPVENDVGGQECDLAATAH